MQNTPSQLRFKFRKLHSKSEKKIFQFVIFQIFLVQIQTAFGETIPKRYNTWGHVVRNQPPATPTRPPPGHTHPNHEIWLQTPSVIPFWNRLIKCSLNLNQKKLKNYKLKDFFFGFTM